MSTPLNEKRGALVAAARERLDQITANTDESRAKELEAAHDAAMTELDKLDAMIERENRTAAAERKLEESRAAFINAQRPPVAASEASAKAAGSSYREAFHAFLRVGGKVEALDGEHRAAMLEARAQTTASGAAGGYTVPTEMLPRLIETMKLAGPMYDPGVTGELVTVGGQTIQIPTLDDTANSAAAQTQGAALLTDGSGDMSFGQKTLGAYSYATPFIQVTLELANDSVFAMESVIAKNLGTRLGRLANHVLTVGTGSGQPQGIVTGAGTVAQAVGQPGAAISFDDLLTLMHGVDPMYRRNAGWMFNDSTMVSLRKVKDSNGRYIWDAGLVTGDVAPTIYGYKYAVNQDMADIAVNSKSVIFGDLSNYIVRKAGSPLVGTVQDSKFWPGFGLAGYIRLDGKVVDTAAIKVLVQNA